MPAVQSAGATVTCNFAQVQTKAEIRHVRRPQAISPCCLHFINKAISMVPWCRLGQLQGMPEAFQDSCKPKQAALQDVCYATMDYTCLLMNSLLREAGNTEINAY